MNLSNLVCFDFWFLTSVGKHLAISLIVIFSAFAMAILVRPRFFRLGFVKTSLKFSSVVCIILSGLTLFFFSVLPSHGGT